MQYEKELTAIKNGKSEVYVYYVKEVKSMEFECLMYNVGVKTGKGYTEIQDFSPSEEEAVLFCDYLHLNNATEETIFLLGEEFILERSI